MAGLQASGYPGRLGNPKPTGKQNKEPKKCVRMGDFIVFSSVEEDEEAFLASSSVDGEDSVVVTQTKTRFVIFWLAVACILLTFLNRKCVFEILPIIHNTARKAFRRAQKTSSDPSELKKLEEMAVKEAQQNKDMCNQMEVPFSSFPSLFSSFLFSSLLFSSLLSSFSLPDRGPQ